MSIFLILLSVIVAALGFWKVTEATFGVAIVAFACLLGIWARIAQAAEHQNELKALKIDSGNALRVLQERPSSGIESDTLSVEKDLKTSTKAIDQLKQASNTDAVRFAEKVPTAWLCICGTNNFLQAERCVRCTRHREFVVEHFTYEAFSDLNQLNPEPLPEELIVLKKALGKDAARFASSFEKSWCCVCGKLNPLDVQQCPRCNRFKSFVLDKYTREAFSGS